MTTNISQDQVTIESGRIAHGLEAAPANVERALAWLRDEGIEVELLGGSLGA